MQQSGVIQHISSWLANYVQQAGTKGFVVGISGGIDSAVTSTLAAKTGMTTLCVEMPIHQHPSEVSRAAEHIEWLKKRFPNVESVSVELTEVFEQFKGALPETDAASEAMALVNSRARLRMSTLYYFAGLKNMLVAGTGNKVEDFGIGFYTKYGDGGVDLSPIADLNKTEVYALAKELGIVESIQQAPPTDGLWGDERTDADQIGATYPELEWAMEFDGDVNAITDREREVLSIYTRLHKANRHKMEAIPVCTIPAELRVHT